MSSYTCNLILQETHKKEIKQLIDKLEKQEELHAELIEQNKVLIEEFKEIKKEKVSNNSSDRKP